MEEEVSQPLSLSVIVTAHTTGGGPLHEIGVGGLRKRTDMDQALVSGAGVCVCACVCVRACACACVRVRVCVCECV